MWIAYAKRPFAGPQQVLEYLGRYTHRVAISNNRILSIDNGKVNFTYRDRKRNNETRIMTLDAHEFIRRFLLHVLPMGFMKIRYFGFLSHKNKKQAIALIRKLIDPGAKLPEKIVETIMEMMLRLTGKDITCCPKCGKGKMKIIKKLPRLHCNSM
ncbi:MAG: transposase [Proteobacteria bacterium]|nr:transposase [Pseudomonadota bacterium]